MHDLYLLEEISFNSGESMGKVSKVIAGRQFYSSYAKTSGRVDEKK